MHAVVRPEEFSCQRHEFPIAGVIKRLDPGNALAKIRMRSSNVRRQLLLRISRPGDQYGARRHDGLRHTLQKRLIYRGVTAAARIGFVMNMLVRMTAVHRRGIHLRRIEVKDPRLVMVDPDQSVIVLVHRLWLLYSRRYFVGARKRSAFVITETDERLIASAAMIGLNSQPIRGYSTPAANGIANALYPNANSRFWRMLCTVASLKRRARTIPRRSPFTSVTCALSMAISVPVPIAMPTSACASAGASLMPSPAIATQRSSPVSMATCRPRPRSVAIAPADSGFTVSATPRMPAAAPSTATRSAVLPPA